MSIPSLEPDPDFSPIVVRMTLKEYRVWESAYDLLAVCKEFVRKVDAGEANSTRSYSQMKAAIRKAELS